MMNKIAIVVNFLTAHPGYLKWGKAKLASKLNVTMENVIEAKKIILKPEIEDTMEVSQEEYDEFCKFLDSKEDAAVEPKSKLPKPFKKGNPDNVLVIGDLHEPFSLTGYLEFCRDQQEKFNCGSVVFIGDVIDNHFSSYHETETEAMGADEELDFAIEKIASWYKVFPEAYVCIGNHDRMAYRKAKTAGVSSKWVRGYSEVLSTPGWDFIEEVEINGVNYNHGEGGTAKTKMRNELQSQVQGHLHSQAYVEYAVGKKFKIFGVQVGCGIDMTAYAMAYGRNYKKSVISCAVILDKGTLPILLPMNL
jgi:hypothetical protein